MRINGLNGANTPVGGMNMTKATDSVSKNIAGAFCQQRYEH